MLHVVDLKGDGELLLKNIKAKWDRLKYQQKVRDSRFFIKKNIQKRIKKSIAICREKKRAEDALN